ncbi:transposase domain-containing protein, partial [Streptomyces sp. NPDC101455]|uniref:transposase domain-containing protein n=1 Tax=Streptomyces sp. NPDC101455 TaxID=3366142 RepID=UPI0037F4DA21
MFQYSTARASAPDESGLVADAFGAGHLGELTRYVPFDLVDAVLAETGRVQQRLRLLPSRVGVYFLLALGLFPHLGCIRVWGMLTSALPSAARVSEKALRDVRHRVGPRPLRRLFDTLAVPLADPEAVKSNGTVCGYAFCCAGSVSCFGSLIQTCLGIGGGSG